MDALAEERISTFTQAVKRTFDLAMARLPQELHGYLERAHALVLHRQVWLGEDGRHAQVLSSDGQTWYVCNGHCTCMGVARAPQGLCKHRLSVMLYRRASELLRERTESACGAVPRPLPVGEGDAVPALPEAPASVNVRLCIGGHECQWTLRDTDETRLAERLQALLSRFPQPAPVSSTGQALEPHPGAAPAAPPAPPTPAGVAQPTPEGWCVVHSVQMTRQSNARGSWFSHQTPDGWCRGKALRA